VIGTSISTEGIFVAKVLMSSSTCLRRQSLGLKLGPSDVAIALSYPACRLFFFAFGAYVMYISIFLHMLMYKDIEKIMSLHPCVPASLAVVS
jgi:hypothetical protein